MTKTNTTTRIEAQDLRIGDLIYTGNAWAEITNVFRQIGGGRNIVIHTDRNGCTDTRRVREHKDYEVR